MTKTGSGPVDHEGAFAFYRAALPTAFFLDQERSTERLFDDDAGAAWRQYGADLPSVVRIDLALKNLAALYPAAFAPGPVFSLPGWYDDDPWGVGFARPPRDQLEALFRTTSPATTSSETLDHARVCWGIPPAPDALGARLTPALQVLVTGDRAMAAVAGAMNARAGVEVRSQVLLVSSSAAARHVLGLACALGHQQGVPRMVAAVADAKPVLEQAKRENWPVPTVMVTSGDASDDDQAGALRLADAWGIRERIEVAG
jgi:hypothetical protein